MRELDLPDIPAGVSDYERRLKYKNLYIRLIDRCRNMTDEELSGYNEVHHIVPKCMGGNNDSENLVKMPVRYHIMAHIVLQESYPDNIKIAYAVSVMTNGMNPVNNSDRNERFSALHKNFSTRTIARAREEAKKLISLSESMTGSNNPNSKSIISPDGIIYESIIEASNITGIPYATLTKWLSGETSSHGWSYYNCSKVDYSKISRDTRLSSKQVIGPDGKRYESIKSACLLNNIAYTTMRYWLSGLTKDNHGWKIYVEKKDDI